MNVALSNFDTQQLAAIDAIADWLKHRTGEQQLFRLFGYAGTGKTTIARHLGELLNGPVVYTAYTGKAALLMARNGCKGASTIHSLIYSPEDLGDANVVFTLNHESMAADAALIVVDECSMVDAKIARDLMSFGNPILLLGDPAQLPPINGDGIFMSDRPDIMLTAIHRQARENPIIALASKVREGATVRPGRYGPLLILPAVEADVEMHTETDQILVGTNALRHDINTALRVANRRIGLDPEVGDRLVCTRNDASKNIFNGGIFTVVEVLQADPKHPKLSLKVKSVDFPDRKAFEVTVCRQSLLGKIETVDWEVRKGTQVFEYGYALTVHKAQGSQWKNLLVYDQSAMFKEHRSKWLYTAITRASDRLTILTDV